MDQSHHIFDIVVIGAGMAGLVVAQQLHHAGYQVLVVEKSRGLGGRLATRRFDHSCADHGTPFLEPISDLLQPLVQVLVDRGQVVPWSDRVYSIGADHQLQVSTQWCPYYIAPTGMSAIAKLIAVDLNIWLNHRVNGISLTDDHHWHLTLEQTDGSSENLTELTAKAIVVAIPAPQALILLEPLTLMGLPPELIENLRTVKFDPCISAIARYPQERQRDLALRETAWRAVVFPDDDDLAWIGWDSSKRIDAKKPVFVLRSKPSFAENYLDVTDLQSAGEQLLARAAHYLIPWLNEPELLQIHKWRYAFPSRSWTQACLGTDIPLPLVCCGDWCGENLIESAVSSGLAAAHQVNLHLAQKKLIPSAAFWQVITKM